MRHKKPIIGLCGGIGAGKSQVAGEFDRQGCRVIASDRLNHEILAEPEVLRELVSWWGPTVQAADGGPDRRRIAEIVFADAAEKRRLEGLVHPLIAERRAAIIRAVENHPAIKAIVIDSPLLLESGLDRECDAVVYVAADDEHRLARLKESRGWVAEELQRRERWQMSLEEKRLRAGFEIDNNGPVARLGPQVAGLLQQVLAQHATGE